jgi:hypothetical protein
MCEPKEPYYFCTDFHDESDSYHKRPIRFPIRTEKQYLKHFQNAGHAKVIGEATPDYLYSKEAARNIHQFNPAAKILIMIRDPVDLLYSLHSHQIYYGGEDIKDFKQALDIESQRRQGKHLPRGVFFPSSLYYSERIRFSEQIKRYLDYFSREQVKICVFDDFQKDNLNIYRNILEFLNIDSDYTPRLKKYNQYRMPRFMFINRTLAAIGDSPAISLLPYQFRNILSSAIRQFNKKSAKRKPLNVGLRKKLMKKGRPAVRELNKLVKRDLERLWGYDRI